MTSEIIDKIIVVLTIIAATVLLTDTVMAIHVCVVLCAIIVVAVDELFKSKYLPFVFAAIEVVAASFYPIAVIAVPSIIYIFVRRLEKHNLIVSFTLLLIALWSSKSFDVGVVTLILSGVACYIAFKTSYYEKVINRSTSLFDEARQEALNNARKRRELREKTDSEIYTARLKERNRIAREIHDNVGHMLTRAVVQMQAILVINKDEKIKPYLEGVNTTINEAMTNIRRSVHELHDDSIDLSIGINELSSTLKDKFDVQVTTSLESPVPNEIKLQVLGIVKECITNISKHSNGDSVKIEVVENVTFWRIKVYDNGKSKPIELSSGSDFATLGGDHGIGLSNINSRAEGLGGRVNITGGDNGFTVITTIPKKG